MDKDGAIFPEQRTGFLNTSTGLKQPIRLVTYLNVEAEIVMRTQEIYNLIGEMMHIDNQMFKSGGFHLQDDLLNERLPTYLYQGFRHGVGERFEPCTFTGREYHCLHHNCVRKFSFVIFYDIRKEWLFGLKHLLDLLFPMTNTHFHAEFLMNMLCQMLRAVHTAVLTAGTSEGKHQAREASLHIAGHVMVGQLIYMIKEFKYFPIIFQETNHRLIQSGKLLVRLVTAGVMGASAVEYVATAISRLIGRQALAIGKAKDFHHQWPFTIVLGESRGAILRMGRIYVSICGLITIGPLAHVRRLNGKLGQLTQPLQHIHHVRIREDVGIESQQFAQVLHGRWNGIKEVLLALKIASEPISAQHLQGTEQDKQAQTGHKMALGWHFHIVFQRLIVVKNEIGRASCRERV